MTDRVDVLVVSLGTTQGLRLADAELVSMLRDAGASVAAVATRIGVTNALRRAYPVNDVVEAIAARRAFAAASRWYRPRAVVFSTTTAALVVGAVDVPFAVWLDSPARLNRVGGASEVLHPLERRQLGRARLVLTWSPTAAAELPLGAAPSVVVPPPIPVAPVAGGSEAREPIAVAYTPDPKAKGLALLCSAWDQASLPGARLVIAGIPRERAHGFLARRGLTLPAGAEVVGMLPQPAFRDLLGRAGVFVSAAAWEDFGIAPLEALDHGALVVCAPGGGPFPALGIARSLAPELVAADRDPATVARALEAAFATSQEQLVAYRREARAALVPYRREATVARIQEDVLPALLGP